MNNLCCWVNQNNFDDCCTKVATWEIRDNDDPNKLENDTYSCDEHLSQLLNKNNTVTYIGPTDDTEPPTLSELQGIAPRITGDLSVVNVL